MSAKSLFDIRTTSFIRGFLRGLGSMVEAYRPLGPELTPRSDLEAIRGDWQRIGNDFRSVIAREHGEAASAGR